MAFRSMARLLADWRASKQRMDLIINDLPRMVGKEAVGVIKENFLLQGYDDGNTFQMWKKRQPSTNRGYDRRNGVKGSVYSSSNPVLHQSGNLENSIDYKVDKTFISGSAGTALEIKVFIGSNLDIIPYAKIHNEGGHIHIPARSQVYTFVGGRFAKKWSSAKFTKSTHPGQDITMPKRQYMPLPGDPPNRKILRAIEAKLKYQIAGAMKTFAQ